jgi:hypothetical protein
VSAPTRHELLWIARRVHDRVMPLSKYHADIVSGLARAEAERMPTDPADELTAEAQRLGLYPLKCRRVGTWWIVRGRHGTGFHRFDGLNMSEAEAQAQAQRLLPTITDDQVTAMAEMMTEGPR